MKTKRISALALTLMIFVNNVSAQDWPQYLGPDRNSISNQRNILHSWPEQGPEVLWTIDVGIGYGGPVVKDGKVYLLDRNDAVGDIMRCFDLSTGEELWKFEYDAPGEVMFPGSRSVPVADDKYVYSCGPYGDLYCFDTETHNPVWTKNVWKDYGGGDIPTWAITQNPLIYGDLLIVASQAPEAGVVAYNKRTGDVKWHTPPLGHLGYVSPSIAKINGEDHVVMITASSRRGEEMGNVVGLNPLTGEKLWEFKDWNCHIPVPSAVDAGDNKLLITGGYELGALMIRVEKQADGSYITTELFRTEEFGDQTKTPLLYEGHFYAQYGTNNKRDGLTCMNMEGEIMWKTKRDPDFNKGSMILADGLILATDGSNTLYLIEPDSAAFKPLAKAELLGSVSTSDENSIASRVGGRTQNWAPIALAEGKLLIRDQRRMLCVKVAE
tara:strand:+ start:1570 stop:2886 length:1317 start_codon:yes stop_codon:yes gene_type:complete